MHVAHILRKYNPQEWGGTESSVVRLFDGLREHQVRPVAFCPALKQQPGFDPLRQSGFDVRTFRARVPVWGITPEQKQQLVALGGNLLSFDLIWKLWCEPELDLIHTHALNRLGGAGLRVAQRRRIPLVLSIHGGLLDLPQRALEYLQEPLRGGVEWGKVFGALLQSRQVARKADAIITFNPTEAQRLKETYPEKRVELLPHGVAVGEYEKDCRAAALEAFPQLKGKALLLIAGRIDPVKNQSWAVSHARCIFERYPDAMLVLAGSSSDSGYSEKVHSEVRRLGLEKNVYFTGGLRFGEPRLRGLFQLASALVLPSLTETFGLVILEAWAAGRPVLSSRNSGALPLIREGENGWFFDLERPQSYQAAAIEALSQPEKGACLGAAGKAEVSAKYDSVMLAGRVKGLYQELIERRPREGG